MTNYLTLEQLTDNFTRAYGGTIKSYIATESDDTYSLTLSRDDFDIMLVAYFKQGKCYLSKLDVHRNSITDTMKLKMIGNAITNLVDCAERIIQRHEYHESMKELQS